MALEQEIKEQEAPPAVRVPSLPGVSRHAVLVDDGEGAPGEGGGLAGGEAPPAFEILAEVGEGAMGVVYRAQQLNPQRVVALKLMKEAMIGSTGARRFAREVQILAMLQHRGIAQFFGAGVFSGVPGARPTAYLAMEFVEGEPLTIYAKQKKLDAAGCVRLIQEVAEVVGFAHRKGVVHRDLKPSNILVEPSGLPKVLDFGLAMVGSGSAREPFLTMEGQLVGTLAYMSPEQASMPHAVDGRADVYALGAILYELLTGSPPLSASGLDLVAAVKQIREVEPRRLGGTHGKPDRDLEAVIHKALAKDVTERYGSAEAFAEDLRRYLAKRPVNARRPSAWYRAHKWVARHKKAVVASVVSTALLIGGAVVVARQSATVSAERHRSAVKEMQQVLARADAAWGAGRYLEAKAGYTQATEGLERLGEPTLEARLGAWEATYSLAHEMGPLRMAEGVSTATFAVSDDDRLVASGGASGWVEVSAVSDRTLVKKLNAGGYVQRLRFSSGGKYLMAALSEQVVVWDVGSGKQLLTHPVEGRGPAECFWNDLVVVKTGDDRVAMIPLQGSGEEQELAVGEPVRAVAGGAEGLKIMTREGRLQRLKEPGGRLVEVGRVAPSPTGGVLVFNGDGTFGAAQFAGRMQLFDARTAKERLVISGYGSGRMTFCGNGAVGAVNQQLTEFTVFSVAAAPLMHLPLRPGSDVFAGKEIAVVRERDRAGLWSLKQNQGCRWLHETGKFDGDGAISADGQRAAFPDGLGHTVVADAQGNVVATFATGVSRALALDEAGRTLAVGTQDGHVRIVDVTTGGTMMESSPGEMRSLCLSRDGRTLAVNALVRSDVHLWRREGDGWKEEVIDVGAQTEWVDLAPDGQSVAVGGPQLAGIWNVGTSKRKSFRMDVPEQFGRRIAFADGGKLVLVKIGESQVGVWDTTTGEKVGMVPDAGTRVMGLAGCDGKRAVMLAGYELILLDMEERRILRRLPTPLRGTREVRMSGDGSQLLVLGTGGGSVVLELPRGR